MFFEWSRSTREYPVSQFNNKIDAWDQQYAVNGMDSVRRIRSKSFGNFKLDDFNGNPFYLFPQDSRRDCGEENQSFNDSRSGQLSLNLTIDRNVATPNLSEFLDFPTRVIVIPGVFLKISKNKSIDFTEVSPSKDSSYFEMIIESDGRLLLDTSSSIIVRNNNRLILKDNSRLYLDTNAAISVIAGGLFCNFGASIRGRGSIVYKGGLHQLMCATVADFLLQDSSNFVLDSNAVLSIPNNTTLHLKGNETALILNPGSKLLFGENSGIVCDSGARLIANDATFSSVDSTKKWNGILLSGSSNDTVRNCKIKNAAYGIVLSGKYDPNESPEQYSTEISGCSFENHTSYVFNSAVYLQNSAHVLLKNNTVSATNLGIGFTHGIYAEYCPGEMLNFIGNDISACNNGMTVIQSSPYIAFNTMNGNSYGESGMFLDNSNGTIKYNIISDFYNSYYSFY